MTEFSGASKNLNQLLATNKSKLDHTFTSLDKTVSNFEVISKSAKDSLLPFDTEETSNTSKFLTTPGFGKAKEKSTQRYIGFAKKPPSTQK
mgnify:CR=1 FL=1